MATLLDDIIGSGGPKRAYEAQSQAYQKYAQESGRTGGELIKFLEREFDNIADRGYQAYDESGDRIESAKNSSLDQFRPYTEGGGEANKMRAAYSGALGADAQQEAFNNYTESPGVAFMREEGMRGINQNASAMGGLGGANRLKRLSEYNQGLSEQSYDKFWGRLGEVANRGYDAAGEMASIYTDAGQKQSGIKERKGAFTTNVAESRMNKIAGQTNNMNQAYLDSIIATGEAKAGRQLAVGNAYTQGIGAVGNAAMAGFGVGTGGMGGGGFSWGSAGNSLFQTAGNKK